MAAAVSSTRPLLCPVFKPCSCNAFFAATELRRSSIPTTGSSEIAYPYEFLSWDPKVKEIEEEDSAKLNQPIDSNSTNKDDKLKWNQRATKESRMAGAR